MSTTKERKKNGRYSYHSFEDSKHEMKKEKDVGTESYGKKATT